MRKQKGIKMEYKKYKFGLIFVLVILIIALMSVNVSACKPNEKVVNGKCVPQGQAVPAAKESIAKPGETPPACPSGCKAANSCAAGQVSYSAADCLTCTGKTFRCKSAPKPAATATECDCSVCGLPKGDCEAGKSPEKVKCSTAPCDKQPIDCNSCTLKQAAGTTGQAAPAVPTGKIDNVNFGGDVGKQTATCYGDYCCTTDGKCYRKTDKGFDTGTTYSLGQVATEACKGQADQAAVTACKEKFTAASATDKAFIDWIREQQKFTFGEGVSLGGQLWGLGEKFGFFTEASNPMAQLNAFFTETKEGLFLSGNWEKSICWETTDFNNPNDGIAFVPGTETVGVWVAGEYTKYRHPSVNDSSKIITEYIYRITSVVNPSGLTINSGTENCFDILDFKYYLDNSVIDIDLDGKGDTVRLVCDSSPYSLTGGNTIIRYSKKVYGIVCIQFITIPFLKSGFSSQLSGGKLCAPIVPTGTQIMESCPYCPPILTGAGATGPFAGSSAVAPYSAPSESRPGVANPSPG